MEFAHFELDRLGGQDDEMQQMMNKHILRIIYEFFREGHTGFSAGYAMSIIERLWRWLPLTPLTGNDGEWTEVSPGMFQNKRDSKVFKENGQAYDGEGRIFTDDGGETWFSSIHSHVKIKFPYYPPLHPEKCEVVSREPFEWRVWVKR
jgi:hypothetical protein